MILPILYSFRRCPYAMRARLALVVSEVQTELREILLRDKNPEFLATSPSGTVPCVKDRDLVIDESLDVMIWALEQNDPLRWLENRDTALGLISTADGPFKAALDRTKYQNRHQSGPTEERAKAAVFLDELNVRLADTSYLAGDHFALADAAIAPFVRQFANIDRPLFDETNGPHLIKWLDQFLEMPLFAGIMTKYPPWQLDANTVLFP